MAYSITVWPLLVSFPSQLNFCLVIFNPHRFLFYKIFLSWSPWTSCYGPWPQGLLFPFFYFILFLTFLLLVLKEGKVFYIFKRLNYLEFEVRNRYPSSICRGKVFSKTVLLLYFFFHVLYTTTKLVYLSYVIILLQDYLIFLC